MDLRDELHVGQRSAVTASASLNSNQRGQVVST
jgi:hypothetical protein